MASSAPRGPLDPNRVARLRIHFRKVISGSLSVTNVKDARLFIESVCVQPDHVACVQTLITNEKAAKAVQLALSADPSPAYLDEAPTLLLRYIQAPELKVIGGGQFLAKLVITIVDPPLFWNALLSAQRARCLLPESTRSFTWFLLQLVSLPPSKAAAYCDVARDPSVLPALLEAFDLETRTYAQKIKHITENVSQPGNLAGEGRPGGRHDNDHEQIWEINIVPTPDEISCDEQPFLRRAVDVEEIIGVGKFSSHIDNQFRLLREDMLRDLREELPIALGIKKGRRRGMLIQDLRLLDVYCNDRNPWSVQLQCSQNLPGMPTASYDQRKKFLVDKYNFLRRGSLACLVADGDPTALVSVTRNEDLLAEQPSVLCVEFPGGGDNIRRALLQLRLATRIDMIQLNTAVFAYEPVLRQLQVTKEIFLRDDLIHWVSGNPVQMIPQQHSDRYDHLIEVLQEDPKRDLQSLLGLSKPTRLDESQVKCFIAGITQRVCLIQGPPGTGKSFSGALIAKAIYHLSEQKILVVCYTNHALDQFLDDLRNVGIPDTSMVRLGSSAKTSLTRKSLLLAAQAGTYKFTRTDWDVMDTRKSEAKAQSGRLQKLFSVFLASSASKSDVFEHLEFSSEDLDFRAAFEVPKDTNGMTRIGKKGKAVNEFYLLDRWAQGLDAGVFKDDIGPEFAQVWQMSVDGRRDALNRWKTQILRDRVSQIYECGQDFNEALVEVNALYGEKDRKILQGKRIIACTTTGAAKYVQAIQSAAPGVLLVEEAGEILESHVLTALGPETKQMILIGDHKQLRPKAHHDLSVEKGDGYDLNRSMFERLLVKGYPHQILSKQHRMRPEISALVRHLTYPNLTDAPGTLNRPALRGFQDNLMFVNHGVFEEEAKDIPDWKDQTTPSSKRNTFEANMTLKCVRYLAQQGYGTDEIVVLTPYVAQLRLLYDVLSEENDPILNDLDTYDLVRAGLMPQGVAKQFKRPLRVSTIDNYQGEESDIVVISLTRSNQRGDIGFLSQPERLNVLLSRARDAMIMIGNADTFLRSRKGKETWQSLFGLLRDGSHIYDGFPVHCERHLDRKAILRSPEDFKLFPDGGCSEPCQSLLRCGVHLCPQRCHQLSDHSKMDCTHIMTSKCPVGHTQSWMCHTSMPSVCKPCEKKRLADEKKQREAFERQQARELEEQQHAMKMADLDDQIRLLRYQWQDRQRAEELMQALEQKKRDLETTRSVAQARSLKPVTPVTKPVRNSVQPGPADSGKRSSPAGLISGRTAIDVNEESLIPEIQSPSEMEWDRMKRRENVSNDALDSLMKMTGLEHVKEQFLNVKAKIDTALRQGTDLKKERLGVVLLGNPGTGKTTIARLYASFLAILGVLPGTEFVETTGSSLASDGVAGAKKHVDTILKSGGGALFLDEAYQLAMGHNYGGKSVLDYLLAEIENQVGKIVFIFAGYSKQMEAFFEHNPGLESRMPYRFKFDDYTDKELLLMLTRSISKKYDDRMKTEGGLHGLYSRIVVRRVGRGRGKEGFGNARALENVLARIAGRQADRLRRERAAGTQPDDFTFTQQDLIGPEPTAAVLSSSAWKELQGMIGLKVVKDAVQAILDRVTLNYQRELAEKPLVEVSFNRVFIGSPGTGKTTVGKLYGQILADIGVLSSAEVILKNPADFTGSVLGQSEEKTKAILKAAEGKVLIIDEAYMLGSAGGVGQATDIYKTAIVDTIVAEVQSTPGEDRCILLLGYEDQMRDMFRNTNPGLSRRFPLSDAFHFEDFDDDQLRQILDFKLRKQSLDATNHAKDVAIKVLAKARRRKHFGNAGEVENMISHAKASHQVRQSSLPATARAIDIVFEPQDFDANFDRDKGAASNLKDLFKDIVGSNEVVAKFDGYIRAVHAMRARNKDPESQIPFNFIFKGPPGTGKTTTARKIGQIYYDMGFLSSTELHECSATDLIAGFVGQTGLKTIQKLDDALGSVLFIDEAYRLAEGHFATEAVNTLVDSLTKPKYMGKMLVILAGYEQNMNDLLKVNPGLSSRFPEEIVFQNMRPEDCFTLLKQKLGKEDVAIEKTGDQDARLREVIERFQALSELSSWGNGRDVETLAKTIIRSTILGSSTDTDADLIATLPQILDQLSSLLHERRARDSLTTTLPTRSKQQTQLPMANDIFINRPPEVVTTTTNVATTENPAQPEGEDPDSALRTPEFETPPEHVEEPSTSFHRDPGVSDTTWQQLETDKRAQDFRHQQIEADNQRETEALQAANQRAATATKELAHLAQQLEQQKHKENKELEALKQRHEKMRLEQILARMAKQRTEERLKRIDEERKKEARAQTKLRQMGVCPVGFHWIKQPGGWRCAGGSHFVGEAELGFWIDVS